MTALGRNIGAQTIALGNIAVAAGASTTHNGRAVNLASLPRPHSVRAHIFARGNLDAADTLTVDQIKLESATSSAFTGAVTRATAADMVLTGAATDTDYFGDVDVDFDLTQLPETHTWVRLSVRSALSDTVNTTGAVGATLVFGGLSSIG